MLSCPIKFEDTTFGIFSLYLINISQLMHSNKELCTQNNFFCWTALKLISFKLKINIKEKVF